MSPPPRLVVVDLDHWDAFASFAPAVRRRGMSVVRVAPPRTGADRRLAELVDRLTFGAAGPTVPPGGVPAGAVSQLLGPPTVDVFAAEDVAEQLRAKLPWGRERVLQGVPDAAHVALLHDKLAMTRFAERLGVDVPRTWERAPAGVLPLVVKGRTGAGGRSVRLARTPEEVAAAHEELAGSAPRGVFHQELVDGVVANIGGVAREGQVLAAGCYEAHPAANTQLGPAERIEIVRVPAIEASLERMLAALQYSGVFCLDYVVRPDGSAALIDFNPRIFGGWLALQTAGVDLLGAYLSLFGLAEAPVPHLPAPGTRVDVRLIPAAGAASWRDLGRRLRYSGRQLRRVAPVTGPAFVVSMGLRALRTSARDALALARR